MCINLLLFLSSCIFAINCGSDIVLPFSQRVIPTILKSYNKFHCTRISKKQALIASENAHYALCPYFLLSWISSIRQREFACQLTLCLIITVKPVLSGHPLGMAYWPVNTGWHFNRGLKTLRVIQENKGSQRAKYLSHDKLTSTCFYLFLDQKEKFKAIWPHTQCDLLH